MASGEPFLPRLFLDRLLGPGLYRIADNSASGQHRDVMYPCGCMARERDLDQFELYPCALHCNSMSHEHESTRRGAG